MPDIYISDTTKDKETTKAKGHAGTKTLQDLKAKESRHRPKGHSRNPLAAFHYLPDGVRFETQEQKEKIILVVRKHPITNVGWLLIAALMLFAPSVLGFFPILDFLPDRFQFVSILVWYAVTTIFIFENFLSWFFDINIITDERIIDIDFNNLIYKEVSEMKIDKLQDVTYKQGGAIRAVFNYGDVYIQTASEIPTFEFLAVPRPDRIVRVLNDLIIEEEQEKIEGRAR